jgi:two-component system cell cycle sensor histidine kinase/response regulator CckA
MAFLANTTHEVKQKHLLVVDDDPDVLMSYKEMLEANNYMISTATNGVEALKLVMHIDVDAIVCDLMMPTMAGDMFYIAIQRVKPHMCKRFIFITGYEGNPRFEEFLKKEKVVVLYKPVTLGKFLGTLNVLFTRATAPVKKV